MNANFESIIVGLLLLAFVVGLAQLSQHSFDQQSSIGIQDTNSTSPAIGE